jgi:hypothetical protein
MQLRNCFNEGMLWFWYVSLIFLFMKIILVICGFSRDVRAVDDFFVVCEVWCLCLACRTWSGHKSVVPLVAWVGTKLVDPLRACVKVADCCDPPSTGTLTCVKSIETCVETAFATVSEWFALADHFSFILVRTVRSSCIASSHLIKEA